MGRSATDVDPLTRGPAADEGCDIDERAAQGRLDIAKVDASGALLPGASIEGWSCTFWGNEPAGLAQDSSIWGTGPVPGRLLTIGCLQPADRTQRSSQNVVVVWSFDRVAG